MKRLIRLYDFQQYETRRSFGGKSFTRKADTVNAEEDESNLLKNIVEFNNESRTRT